MEARKVMDKATLERDFQDTVVKYARLHGWLVFGVIDRKDYARRYDTGFPDLVFVRDGVLIFAELKKEGAKVTPAQDKWLRALQAVADRAQDVQLEDFSPIKVCTWRPSDWDAIEKMLGGHEH